MKPDIGLLIFLPLFCLFWCVVLYILSRMGKWAALAGRYRVSAVPFGKRFVCQSGKVGVVNYNSCLNVIVSGDGLYLSIFPLFRPWHPPLLIPWSDLLNLKEKKMLWFLKFMEMQVCEPSITTIQLPSRIFEQWPSATVPL